MYCQQCGAPANGNFCANCGTALRAAQPARESAGPLSPDEVRYAVIIQDSEVRNAIKASAANATRGLSAEKFLEICDLALGPALGVPLKPLVAVAQPLFTKLGIRTGKQRTVGYPFPTAPVMTGVLCSLALRAQPIRQVTQYDDGCRIEAAIPSDLRTMEADLFIEIKRGAANTRVDAATDIKGQLVDWGKSRQVLNTLFSDLAQSLARFSDSTRAA